MNLKSFHLIYNPPVIIFEYLHNVHQQVQEIVMEEPNWLLQQQIKSNQKVCSIQNTKCPYMTSINLCFQQKWRQLNTIYLGSTDKTAKLWQLETGKYDCININEDKFLTGSFDKTAMILGVRLGYLFICMMKIQEKSQEYSLTGSIDKFSKIWDITTDEYIETLRRIKDVQL